MNASLYHDRNFIYIEKLQEKLERKVLSLEKNVFEVNKAFGIIDSEIEALKKRYAHYQDLYTYEYLMRLGASLRNLREKYKYRKGPFNVVYFLLEKLGDFHEEFLSGKVIPFGRPFSFAGASGPKRLKGDPPLREYIFQTSRPGGSAAFESGKEIVFYGEGKSDFKFRKVPALQKTELYSLKADRPMHKFASILIGGINFLVPFDEFLLVKLSSTFQIRNSKIFNIKKGKKTYRVYQLLRFIRDINLQLEHLAEYPALKDYEKSVSANPVSRPLVLLVSLQKNHFGLVIDKYERKFLDHGAMIMKKSVSSSESSLVSGRFRFQRKNYLILDPKALVIPASI